MTGLFSAPKMPAPPKPSDLPAVPERTSADTAAAAEAQRQKFYGTQGGRASTMLTGGMGDSSATGSAVRLLGNTGR